MTEHLRDDEGHSENAAYETRDIKIRPLLVFGAGIAVLIVFSFLVALWVFRLFNAQQTTRDAQSATSSLARPATPTPADEQMRWPEPRIQSRPADDLSALRAKEEVSLTTYGWVDRANGVVRVPIDVAMRLVLEEGLPARPPAIVSPDHPREVAFPATGTPVPPTAPRGAKQRQRSP